MAQGRVPFPILWRDRLTPWQVLSSGREVASSDTTSQAKCHCSLQLQTNIPDPYPTYKYESHKSTKIGIDGC